MKKLKNKELEVELIELRQESETGTFIKVPNSSKVTYADLLVQIAKQPGPQGSVGDLEEQVSRMDIIKKAKKSKVDQVIELEDSEVKLLVGNLVNWKLVVLDEGLIEFQKELKG